MGASERKRSGREGVALPLTREKRLLAWARGRRASGAAGSSSWAQCTHYGAGAAYQAVPPGAPYSSEPPCNRRNRHTPQPATSFRARRFDDAICSREKTTPPYFLTWFVPPRAPNRHCLRMAARERPRQGPGSRGSGSRISGVGVVRGAWGVTPGRPRVVLILSFSDFGRWRLLRIPLHIRSRLSSPPPNPVLWSRY